MIAAMALRLRPAQPSDAASLWQAVNDCAQLDSNSFYCYWLLCKEFGASCIVAEEDGCVSGFVTGFRPS